MSLCKKLLDLDTCNVGYAIFAVGRCTKTAGNEVPWERLVRVHLSTVTGHTYRS